MTRTTDTNGVRHLWRLNLVNGFSVQISNGLGETNPDCTRMGSVVCYQGETAEGPMKVFRMAASGGEATLLSELPAIGPPIVSPDGKHVLFSTPQKDGTVHAVAISADTGSTESEYRVPETAAAFTANWMADNRSVGVADVRSGNSNLWTWPVLGHGSEKQITHFNDGSIRNFQFSPDGKWIVMTRTFAKSDAVLFTQTN